MQVTTGSTACGGDAADNLRACASDTLGVPIDFSALRGKDSTHSLVFGGGGLYFIAWHFGLLEGLAERGIDVSRADRVIGTSAGGVAGALLCTGRLRFMSTWLGTLLTLGPVNSALGSSTMTPSAQRAYDLGVANDGSPESVKAIGRAALAAVIPHPGTVRRILRVCLGSGWPTTPLLVTATDCYTAERLVLGCGSTGLDRAVAASICIPGVYAPQVIGDRHCMDGGIVGTAIHADLAAGATHVLVTSLDTDLTTAAQHAARRSEINALRASGSTVCHIQATGVPDAMLMDATAVPRALAEGRRAAQRHADELIVGWRTGAVPPKTS